MLREPAAVEAYLLAVTCKVVVACLLHFILLSERTPSLMPMLQLMEMVALS